MSVGWNSGDHAVTAKTIAKAVRLTDSDPIVLEGRNLRSISRMSAAELNPVFKADVFARVSPAQKLELVAAFQKHGEIVAITGDGVKDAPALKQADIGVAMGLRGTQVAREAAAMMRSVRLLRRSARAGSSFAISSDL